MAFLHIEIFAHYLGVQSKRFIAIDYQEFGDERHRQSIAKAEETVDVLVERLVTARPVDATVSAG